MRFLVNFLIAILLSSCAGRVDIQTIKPGADEVRIILMRQESEVYGDFFRTRSFHQELMQVIIDTNATPYRALDSLFRLTIPAANEVVIERILFDSTYNKIKAISLAHDGKVKKTSSLERLIQQLETEKYTRPMVQQHAVEKYYNIRKPYQELCLTHSIYRLDPQQYAEVINEKVIHWQDSLEEVGRLIASEKNDLKLRFPSQKGADFFAAYRPVSELEAMIKNMDSMLAQLNNSLSRFEEGNKEDYIYFGPKMRVRMEVQATQDLFGSIAIQMKDCRKKSLEYWSYKE